MRVRGTLRACDQVAGAVAAVGHVREVGGRCERGDEEEREAGARDERESERADEVEGEKGGHQEITAVRLRVVQDEGGD